MTVSDHLSNPFGIQWQRYWKGAPYPDLVKTVPHVAFEVDDLAAALAGHHVIIEPNSPRRGVTVAFIESAGHRSSSCRSITRPAGSVVNQAGARACGPMHRIATDWLNRSQRLDRCPLHLIAAEAGIAGWPYPPAMCYHVQVENRIASLVVDATDAEQLAQFWAGALGWQVVKRGSYGVSIGVDGGPFEIDFRFVPDGPKLTKNRLHLDVKPVNRDQAAELDRLLALGARQVDVGQGAQNWFVLADPEGNEFCLCRP